MERKMTVTEAARNFADVVARAFYRGESARLIKNGRAVARIVPVEEAVRFNTGTELAKRWADPNRPRLSPAEAEALEADLKEARRALPPLEATSWE
jgi:antitoxin (DNA-binding transcriptional repressor) of toxin-antitoxin stability system